MKIKDIHLFSLLFFFPVFLIGQNLCDVGNTLFTRQSQLDSFAILYPECQEIKVIKIFGQEIHNLSGLRNLKKIDWLKIEGTKIQNLDDLPSLREISSLSFRNNDNTKVLSFHDSLIINRTISIGDCDSLKDIINYIEFDIQSLVIYNNSQLNSIEHLKINHLQNALFVKNNFYDLSQHSIKHCVSLSLVDFNDLNKIQYFPFEELFLGPTSLSSIEDLNSVKKMRKLVLSDNKNLSNCSIDIICHNLDNPEFILELYPTNASGCNTIDEIRAGCSLNSTYQKDIDKVKIYPNPFFTDIYIETSIDLSHYAVLNVYGELVHEGPFNKYLELNHLQSGVYLLNLYNSNNDLIKTRKLIKIE
jgi:hypothetical protein